MLKLHTVPSLLQITFALVVCTLMALPAAADQPGTAQTWHWVEIDEDGQHAHAVLEDHKTGAWHYVIIHVETNNVIYAEVIPEVNPSPEDDGSNRGFDKKTIVQALKDGLLKENVPSEYENVLISKTPFGKVLLAKGKLLDAVWNPGDERGPTVKKKKEDLKLNQSADEFEQELTYEGFGQSFKPGEGSVTQQFIDYLKKGKKKDFANPSFAGGNKGPSNLDKQNAGYNYSDDMLGDPTIVLPPPPGVAKGFHLFGGATHLTGAGGSSNSPAAPALRSNTATMMGGFGGNLGGGARPIGPRPAAPTR